MFVCLAILKNTAFPLILFMPISTWSSVLLSSFQAFINRTFVPDRPLQALTLKQSREKYEQKTRGKTIGNKVGVKPLYNSKYYQVTTFFFSFTTRLSFFCKGPTLQLNSFSYLSVCNDVSQRELTQECQAHH